MVSFSQLRKIDPNQFDQLADGFHSVNSCASQAKDSLNNGVMPKFKLGTKGAAATAATGRLRGMSKNFHYIQVETGLVRSTLRALADELTSAQRRLRNVLKEISEEGMTVKSDGSIHFTRGPEESEGLKNQSKQQKATAFAHRISDILKEATETDERYRKLFIELIAPPGTKVDADIWADVADDQRKVGKRTLKDLDIHIPKDGSPRENRDWWRTLTPEEQADVVALRPASIGAMDGLPSEVRDEANRAVMEEKKGKYQLQLAELPAAPARYMSRTGNAGSTDVSPEWKEWREKYGEERSRIQRHLRGIQAIEKRFEATGKDGLPEAYLLGFDPEKENNGKVILANGNPDKADHVGTYVPGTTTDQGDIEKDINRTVDLWRKTNGLPGMQQEVSTVMWFDYDAPDSVFTEAPRGKYSRESKSDLDHFLRGTQVGQEEVRGEKSHSTVLGHSYGSRLVGDTAMLDGAKNPIADDIVTLGSPGVRAMHAEELGVGADHVWAATAGGRDDWVVRNVGSLFHGGGPKHITPDDWRFGAKVIESDAPDHGGYWEKDSKILLNQARIIAGNYGKVSLAD